MARTTPARRLASPRVPRFKSWKALQAAVLDYCRTHIREENPTFDVAQLEDRLRVWLSDWTTKGDEAVEHYVKVQRVLTEADEFLKAAPVAAARNPYAAMLEGFFSARVEGHDGGFGLSVRERLARRPPLTKKDVWRFGLSPRARLIAVFTNVPPDFAWWKDRTPSNRDLAIVNLLAGQWPEGARRRQVAGKSADRPTVMEVVQAEESSVRTTRNRKQNPKKS